MPVPRLDLHADPVELTAALVDIPSVSHDEAVIADAVETALREQTSGFEIVRCGNAVLARTNRGLGSRVMLAGHLDTVPAQDNIPGRIEDGRVFGLGASDMKGALALMMELVLARAPYAAVFFPREELPANESALAPLLKRRKLDQEFVVVMEPTDGELHAGCLGNINATWTFSGRSGHSARPWQADNAIHRAAAGIAELAAVEDALRIALATRVRVVGNERAGRIEVVYSSREELDRLVELITTPAR